MKKRTDAEWEQLWCLQLNYKPSDFTDDDGTKPFTKVPISVLLDSGNKISLMDFKENRWAKDFKQTMKNKPVEPTQIVKDKSPIKKPRPGQKSKREKIIRKCDVCNKTFTRWTNLRAHEYTHLGKRFKCTQPGCTKKFQTEHTRTEHINGVHLKIQHTCNVCGKKYLFRGSLFKHQQTHKKPKQDSRPSKHRRSSKRDQMLDKNPKRRNPGRKVKQASRSPIMDSADEIDSLNDFP